MLRNSQEKNPIVSRNIGPFSAIFIEKRTSCRVSSEFGHRSFREFSHTNKSRENYCFYF